MAVLGLIIAYISPYVPPSTTSLFSLFGLGYPFLLVTNIAFFFSWLAFKPKNAVLSGLFLLLGFGAIRKTIGFNFETPQENGISVMTYNIGKTRLDFHYKKTKDKSIERFRRFVERESPDIICIQERLPRHLKYYKKIFTGYKLYPNTDIGTAIYSKFPIVDAGNLAFDTKSHNATWADVKVKGKIFRVYSIHLSSNRVPNLTDNVKEIWDESRHIMDKYNEHAIIRKKQLDRIIGHAKACPHPVVINGDFNDVPQSFVYNTIANQYKDAFLTGGKGLMQTFRSRFLGLRIDYTFVSDDVDILDHKVIDTNISDHLPVVTTFLLNGETS